MTELEMQRLARDDVPRTARSEGDRMTKGIGWLSVGLGVAALTAPRRLARLIGAGDGRDVRALIYAVGLRELASGFGVLANRPGFVYGRVAGDVMDLGLLAAASRRPDADRGRLLAAGAAVLGVTALDALASARAARVPHPERMKLVTRSITVRRPVGEVYAFWRDFTNLPRFMKHLEKVEVLDALRSRWTTSGPLGTHVTWEASIVEDVPNELIAWRSLPGGAVETAGSVELRAAPGDRGTEVHVRMAVHVPLGAITTTALKLFRESPEQQVADDLRAFKQMIETGGIVASEASVHRRPHPGQPSRVAPEAAAIEGGAS